MTETNRSIEEKSCLPSLSSSGVVSIPSGLNRIRTPRPSSKQEEPAGSRWTPSKSKQNHHKTVTAHTRGKIVSSSSRREQLPNGKTKITRWLKSHFFSDAGSVITNAPPNVEERKLVADAEIRFSTGGNPMDGQQPWSDALNTSKVPKGLKSFSHELGPKGSIPPPQPRSHSYSDLTELLGSFHTRFDAAKELANEELASIGRDIMHVLLQMDTALPEDKTMAEDLFLVAQMCMEITSSHFRAFCEMIVQDLTKKRQQCQTGALKWLFTRMLFILTRCTRLLQVQKNGGSIDEKSLRNFKKCLESVPSVEMSWATNRGITDPDPELFDRSVANSKKDSLVSEMKSPSQRQGNDTMQQFHLAENSLIDNSNCDIPHEQMQSLDDSLQDQEHVLEGPDSVICRICEEIVPVSHIESHSYICAYADKCIQNSLDIDDRLSSLAEILEQIVEFHTMNSLLSHGSPENSRTHGTNCITTEEYSPKISKWHNKGVEGMFEDIHEMDTAFIDDTHLPPLNLKGHLGIKLCNNYGASSSTGSITSFFSTNTPKTGHFDSFWLTHNNPSELEDVQLMMELADIARCVASTNLSSDGSNDFLFACMQDLQDILQHSKLKALVIETFGARVEKLLWEKYLSVCDHKEAKSPINDGSSKEMAQFLQDITSQSSAASTPVHSSNKERTSIDDFEIIKPVSRGAFGKVFLARKRTTGDLFAIKVLKKLDMVCKNDVQRILAERNILITARNPFVVRFYYSFTCRDNLYLVMEYLNGGDLYSMLRKVGCLAEDVARIYIAELVLALEYLHSLGIVHRDLKPDNILIAHDGHIKLTDFGLSKIGLINSTLDLPKQEANSSTSSNSLHNHSQQGKNGSHHSAVGTPDYLAPEILLGTEHGYAADWWSVGIILFEFLTGIPPFTAEHPEIIFDNILNKEIPWPVVPDEMSYEAKDLINRLLIYDPDERLGANGSKEVKSHTFFRGVNWDNLALQKAVFVPSLDSADDISYFLSRYSQLHSQKSNAGDSSPSDSGTCDSSSQSGAEVDEYADLAELDDSSLYLSSLNFSFKNLSQLASINHDVFLQTAKDPSKSHPSKA